MQFALHITYGILYRNINNSQTTDETSTSRKSTCASRQSERAWKIVTFTRSKTRISFSVWVGTNRFVCIIWHVCWLLCYICTCNAVFLLYITDDMALYKLTNYQQNTHIEIERQKFVPFLHSKPARSFIIFIGILQIFCWYNMTFNLEILEVDGMVIHATPPQILGGGGGGGGYIPHSPVIDTHVKYI